MDRMRIAVVGLALFAAATVFAAEVHSIKSEVDKKKIYWGDPSAFSHAGEVDYQKVVQKTDEYVELRKRRIKRGTGKYWILMSKASDRTVRAISDVGVMPEGTYDLIAAKGYLKTVEPPQKANDVTHLVLRYLEKPLVRKKPEEKDS